MNELIKKISILFIIISLIGFGSAMHFDLEERFEDPIANRIIFNHNSRYQFSSIDTVFFERNYADSEGYTVDLIYGNPLLMK